MAMLRKKSRRCCPTHTDNCHKQETDFALQDKDFNRVNCMVESLSVLGGSQGRL